MKRVAFFNSKGGVGRTTLVYHLAAMFAELGVRVLMVDLDPQANLTTMCVDDPKLEQFWSDGSHRETMLGAVAPIIDGTGDIRTIVPYKVDINPRLALLPGDLGLIDFEDHLTWAWRHFDEGPIDSARSITALARVIAGSAKQWQADLVLIDVSPYIGTLNHAALICADQVVIPLAPDLFAPQALRVVGHALHAWRDEWTARRQENTIVPYLIPESVMEPLGYVLMRHGSGANRQLMARNSRLERIPDVYRRNVLGDHAVRTSIDPDPNCLAVLKNYHTLVSLARESRKPMFALRPADGALGAQQAAVRACYDDFHRLALEIASRLELTLPLEEGRSA